MTSLHVQRESSRRAYSARLEGSHGAVTIHARLASRPARPGPPSAPGGWFWGLATEGLEALLVADHELLQGGRVLRRRFGVQLVKGPETRELLRLVPATLRAALLGLTQSPVVFDTSTYVGGTSGSS